jgi:hypothetical protein
MNLLRVSIVSALLAIANIGCVTNVHHHFDGLGPNGDASHLLTVSVGQFYKSSEGEWHYTRTTSQQYPTTTMWPSAFGIHCMESDFDLQKVTVRDKNGVVLPFVLLASVQDNPPESKQPGLLVILAPQESVHSEKTTILATGVYQIEATYRAGGELCQARWTSIHTAKTDVDVWTMPRS